MSATVLEHVEKVEAQPRPPMLHAYCRFCLDTLYPERITPLCGHGRQRNADEMQYSYSYTDAPAGDCCVVCVHTVRCSRCGV